MKIQYISRKFTAGSLALIETVNAIIAEYQAQGFDLTLRQIYYQLVARGLLANRQTEYKRVGGIINNGRLAGLISWRAIVDRTRHIRRNSHWETPREILQSAAYSYLEDRWTDQVWRPEVWIEKDALIGVIANICGEYDVPYFSCRGYTSQSAMWQAGHERLLKNHQDGQRSLIIHLADHDPSGIDMSRDIGARLAMFAGWESHEVERIALNMDQIEALSPPPNPTKLSDSRARAYIAKYGSDSWELDALEPRAIVALVSGILDKIIDRGKWEKAEERIQEHRDTLGEIANNYRTIKHFLKENS